MTEISEELLTMGAPGQSLRIELLGPYSSAAAVSSARDWLNATIHVEAAPFSGSIRTILTPEDVAQYQRALKEFANTGHATLGGGRGVEITLERDGQVIEVTVTPSGDDPQPFIRYLIFLESPV